MLDRDIPALCSNPICVILRFVALLLFLPLKIVSSLGFEIQMNAMIFGFHRLTILPLINHRSSSRVAAFATKYSTQLFFFSLCTGGHALVMALGLVSKDIWATFGFC